MNTFRLLIFALILCGPSSIAANRTVIHAGTLIDGDSNESISRVTVVVTGQRIERVQKGFIAPNEGDQFIDLSRETVLPGLIDMHTHLTFQLNPGAYVQRFQLGAADRALMSVPYAETTLMAGFTTVRDLGDWFNVTIALRKAIGEGKVKGPRIFTAAKSIATTGGHADPTNGWLHGVLPDPGPFEGVINSPADARKAVRQRYKDGADLIKITATGGVLSVAKSGSNPQFTQEEADALILAAKDYGFKVAAHAHGAEGMKRAIRAGVDSIEHGTFMDEEVMEMMKKHGTFYVPTLLAGAFVAEKAQIKGYFPDIIRPKAASVGPQIFETFKKAYAHGVTIAFGTDSGVSPHGINAREFALMVKAGMPEMEAIKAATTTAAKLLGNEEVGHIAAGKYADIVAVKGDPLEDITELERITFVMKDGKVYKHN